ncbi:MAG: M24 family metallopeptidase, partial [Bacteroidaceae bacterium]|nr:M24 family metallopeptidase [Bacteroidaceae bacterium]
MKEQIIERVAQVRALLAGKGNGAEVLIVPTMDPHNSEYVAAHWQARQWLTGFTGSAGTAVLTANEALLWTDSRYWLQAAEQLAGTPFRLMREGEDEDIATWLSVHSNGRIAFPKDMMTPSLFGDLFPGKLKDRTVALRATFFDALWTDRPPLPLSTATLMPDSLAGETAQSKLGRIIGWLEERGRKQLFLAELSEICWTLNLRADDIPYNPLLIAFLMLRTNGKHSLYVHEVQLPIAIKERLKALNVEVRPYAEGLRMQQSRLRRTEDESPVPEFRALKNRTEQEGFRQAHLRDGVAMVRFLHELEASEQTWTELSVDARLTALRREQPGFCGLSFETIAACGPHGAIVHYEATADTSVELPRRGFLLLDSGAHYDCGTTDITRTIALGPLTDEERLVYTLVLRGHLQLQHLQLPEQTTGLQLDTAARSAMWREGYDFGHGTGHGVGHRLGVHEGPLQIRKNMRACTLLYIRAGQVITDEPGIYVAGRFGVRIENMLLCCKAEDTDFG